MPRFVTVKVPPVNSSLASFPCLAFSVNSLIAVSISFRDFLSALCMTGTTKPYSVATANPTFTSSKIFIWFPSNVEFIIGCSSRAFATTSIRIVVYETWSFSCNPPALEMSTSIIIVLCGAVLKLAETRSADVFLKPVKAIISLIFGRVPRTSSMNLLTSSLTILPSGPLPLTSDKSISYSLAKRFADGEAKTLFSVSSTA